MYAKLENNKLIPSPRKVRTPGWGIFNPGREQLRALGYKAVVYPTVEALDGVVPVPESW